MTRWKLLAQYLQIYACKAKKPSDIGCELCELGKFVKHNKDKNGLLGNVYRCTTCRPGAVCSKACIKTLNYVFILHIFVINKLFLVHCSSLPPGEMSSMYRRSNL